MQREGDDKPSNTRGRTAMSLLCAVLLLMGTHAHAQQNDPLLQQLVQTFQRDYLTIGALFQTVADGQIERTAPGENGFSVANFRLRVLGELDNGFGYLLQTNFTGAPAILDARMSYRFHPSVRVMVGQFKSPFSAEFLTYAGSIDFVNRAQAVTALAPGRQIGAQAEWRHDALGISAGVFNGNATVVNGNDGDGFLYVARANGQWPLTTSGDTPASLELGLNAAYSNDDAVNIGGVITSFTGNRAVFGGDARLVHGRLLVAAEALVMSLDPDLGANRTPWGSHVTAGYMSSAKTQLLVRWDGFERDDGTDRQDYVILGLNVWPTLATEVQVNYLIDPDDAAFDHHQLLVNFQLGF